MTKLISSSLPRRQIIRWASLTALAAGLTMTGCVDQRLSPLSPSVKCVSTNDGKTKCAEAGEAMATSNDAGLIREWMMVGFPGYEKEELVAVSAKMLLDEEQRYGAMMGCNNLGGRYEVDATNGITFSEMYSTRMFCHGMEAALEKDFVAALPMVVRYQIDGHQLRLWTQSGEQIVFVAADWD